MNLINKIKYQLENNIKFLALLSVVFQLIILLIKFSGGKNDAIFLAFFIFYPFNIVIGVSRYLEVNSRSKKERFLNFFYLLNCFPFIHVLVVLGILTYITINNPSRDKINLYKPEEVNIIYINKNGDTIEKNGSEIKFDISNKKLHDSIIDIKIIK